jgi:beta-galactosidase
MKFSKLSATALINCLMVLATVAGGATVSASITASKAPSAADFKMGTSRAPDGQTLTIDSSSIVLDGKPWTPVMGEFHYTRYPASEWRDELLKMKAGGINIVSTYVFWIHHEEVEGQWDWSGDRDLRTFIKTAAGVGLKVVVRCGPWCHGEVRNGGFPDWLLTKGWKLRTVDPQYLVAVRGLYHQISTQLAGQLWKDGGPVVGIQVDNEYEGPADYLVALKAIAREEGLDVPLYTRTGWTQVTTPLPFGEIVPLYGAYAEGFWSRELTSMPGNFWGAFRFSRLRFDDNIATELMGAHDVHDAPDVGRYPYLTCEIGGGMMSSYHRRILINPEDVLSTVMVKLGSGSTLPGYYMYQGGTNPEGKLTTLMEAQGTEMTNYNDLPVRNYDFQAPLGEFGQLRPQYHLLRRLHLFLADFGEEFARMGTYMPDQRPGPRGDISTLRWAVRSNGSAGYVFINNYERSTEMPAKAAVQFQLSMPAGTLTFPASPVDIPRNSVFFWPFNLPLGHAVTLEYATAQPTCVVDSLGEKTVFFAEIPGVAPRFKIAGEATERSAVPGRGIAFSVLGSGGETVHFVLLSEADSLAVWKGSFGGRDRVFLTRAGLVLDNGRVRLTSSDRSDLSVGIFPAPEALRGGIPDGIFTSYSPALPAATAIPARLVQIRRAGPAREIPIGKIKDPEATEPSDQDFAAAATWRIELPPHVDMSLDPILRVHYVGDVARFTLGSHLLVDDFYNGNAFDLGLRRYGADLKTGSLTLSILPLRADALAGEKKRIFMADTAPPEFSGAPSIAAVQSIEVIPRYEVDLPAEN